MRSTDLFQETEPSAACSRVFADEPWTAGVNLTDRMQERGWPGSRDDPGCGPSDERPGGPGACEDGAMRSDPRHHPASAIDFLHRHDSAAALLPTAERLLRLSGDLLGAMSPALRPSCEVTGFDGTSVVLRVTSASVAAKLRQIVPRLEEHVAARGWKIDGIRVRVRPRPAAKGPVAWMSPARPRIPERGIAAFADLGQRLDESPLRAAVERLLARRHPGSD